jgi:hypothetical protein
MTRRRKAKAPDYAVSDEAAAYIADALMQFALRFEATHFAQIRRHYQSITPARSQPERFERPSARNSKARDTSQN